jgi:uncharacterized protein YkwD
MPARPPGRRRATPRRGPRARPAGPLAATVLAAVIVLAGALALVLHRPGGSAQPAADAASPAAGHPAGDGGRHRAGRPARAAAGCTHPAGTARCPGPAGSPGPRPAARPGRRAAHRPASRPAAPRRRARPSAAPPAAPASAAPSAAPPSPAPPAGGGPLAVRQVLALINQARAQAGLPGYTISAGLDTSAARHNAVMAAGCGLSHQCPGEPPLGDRETAAGVHWTAAGENIGEGGPVAATAGAIAQLAAALTRSMLAEQPPADGHRRNILSPAFTHVGIAVYRDAAGTVWLTQDFSN